MFFKSVKIFFIYIFNEFVLSLDNYSLFPACYMFATNNKDTIVVEILQKKIFLYIEKTFSKRFLQLCMQSK